LAAAAQPCDDDIQAPLAAFFAKLGTIYTMAQERDIQARIAADWGIVTETAPSPATAPNESDNFEDALF
jgi:hypothetical protein